MIIDCKELYNEVVESIKEKAKNIKMSYTCYIIKDENGGVDPASERYVGLKHKTSEECGVECNVKKLSKDEFRAEMMDKIMNSNGNSRTMLQLPAPEECLAIYKMAIAEKAVIDVDYLFEGEKAKGNPATAEGVLFILKRVLKDLSGRKIAVVGARSKTVGKFLPAMLMKEDATVSMYHSKSIIKRKEFKHYDVVISCVGKARHINRCKLGFDNKVLIDIGVSIVDGKVVGDFCESVRYGNMVTPYVGGVGLMTRVFLVKNVADTY